MKRVTVSVVSHRQAHLVVELLTDLDLLCGEAVEKVILTCNLPEDIHLDPRGYAFPIDVVCNPLPLGFGANHNKAFASSSSEWFLVINPDVRLTTNAVSELLGRARVTTALLAPLEMSVDAQKAEGPRGLITPFELVRRKLKPLSVAPVRHGGWVKGMFILLRADAFRAVGGFDERFFLYCEDFDLCARLMIEGWSVDHHADIAVIHAWQRKSLASPWHMRRHLASLFRMWSSRTFWAYRGLLRRNGLP
jgi:GT2 family glycosyltransferase